MRAPRKPDPEDEEVQWVGEEGVHEREVGGDDEERAAEDGCFRLSKIKVLRGRQLRLPASFPRAASFPRRFARSVTPTPAREEKQDPPEVTPKEVSRLSVRGSKKRAASTSPSRNEFRRSLKERLPRQLRSLLSARGAQPSEKLPPKPSRKAGPVGRTWVKVYDDITYMDDSAEEYHPVLGYSGAPFKIPEADPLPTPPTPPPERQAVPARASPTPSQKSEYDNVPKEEIKADLEQANKQYLSDQELILREISLKQMNEARQKEAVPVRPTARKRDNNRFKRREKRSGTPVATDPVTNGFHVSQSQPFNDTFEDVMYDRGNVVKVTPVEDDYIVPERSVSPPARPKRGHKIYETVEQKDEIQLLIRIEVPQKEEIEPLIKSDVAQKEETQPLTKSDVILLDETNIKVETLEETAASPDEPARPVRGIKIYETTIVNKNEDEQKPKIETTPVQPDVDLEKKGDKQLSENMEITHFPASIAMPEKPKRGVKIYDDVNPRKDMEANKENVAPKPSEAKPKSNISNDILDFHDPPSKPVRGNKIYTAINIADGVKRSDIAKELTNGSMQNKNVMGSSVKQFDSENRPSYAQVHKGRDSQMKETSVSEDTPPPIPPKKKARRDFVSGEVIEPVPPRPARHLKPRLSSNEVVSRPKRRKTDSRTKNSHIDSLEIDEEAPPKKPVRGTVNKTNVPPRRKKAPTGDPVFARMTLETGKASQVTLLPADDNYENVTLQGETKINFRSRPLPPPPVVTMKETDISNAETFKQGLPTDATTTNDAGTPATQSHVKGSMEVPSVEASVPDDSHRTEGAEPSVVRHSDNTRVSTADEAVVSGVSIVSAPGDLDGRLEEGIDVNLKNIESSFATLDTVLQSLKSYAVPPQFVAKPLVEGDHVLNAPENELSYHCSEPSQTGHSVLDNEIGDRNVNTIDANSGCRKEELCGYDESSEVLKDSLGSLRSESDGQAEPISPDHVLKTTVAGMIIEVLPSADGTSSVTMLASSVVPEQAVASQSDVSCYLVEDRLLPVATSAISINVDGTETVTEAITEGVPSAVSLTSEVVSPHRKLSIGAESVATQDESILLNGSIHINAYISDSITDGNAIQNIPNSVSLTSEIVSPVRKLSVGAENVAAMDESIIIQCDPSIDTPVDLVIEGANSTTECGRKISVAAETVALEFMPETAQSITTTDDGGNETASVVPPEGSAPVSVAAVSVALGEFADTVTNTTSEYADASVATVTVEPSELSNPQLVTIVVTTDEQSTVSESTCAEVSEKTDVLSIKDVPSISEAVDVSSSTENVVKNEGLETSQSSACDSLEGSQTSITDDDSVVSVVTKEELAAREAGAATDLPKEAPSSGQEGDQGDSENLKEGMTDINNRLEGINSFLDSIVRNFPSSGTEPAEHLSASCDQLSCAAVEQSPCPSSNKSTQLNSSVHDISNVSSGPTNVKRGSVDELQHVVDPAPSCELASILPPESESLHEAPTTLSSEPSPFDACPATPPHAPPSCAASDATAVTTTSSQSEGAAARSDDALESSREQSCRDDEGVEVMHEDTESFANDSANVHAVSNIFQTEVIFESETKLEVDDAATKPTAVDDAASKPTPVVGVAAAARQKTALPAVSLETPMKAVLVATQAISAPNIFTALNSGGVERDRSHGPAFAVIYVDGEWVRL